MTGCVDEAATTDPGDPNWIGSRVGTRDGDRRARTEEESDDDPTRSRPAVWVEPPVAVPVDLPLAPDVGA
ncbi:MAG: hypothetical protein ACRD0E_06110, partial [Acidimicrobiales bacterium]